jgi:hypothetical protein
MYSPGATLARGSLGLLVALENHGAVVFIPIRVISVDFDDLGDQAPTWAPLEMNDYIYGIADICLDRAVGNFDSALQDTAREAGESLTRARRMNGRKTPGVTRIEQLQQVKCLASANLADIRTGYACGYCELKDGILTLIPHPDSGERIKTFKYPSEVTIVGRVTGIAMRIEEDKAFRGKESKKPSKR